MDNFTESVYFKDLESRFIAINIACAKKFGLDSPDEAIGRTDFDFFAIEHAQKAMEDEQLIMATLEPIINVQEREVFNDADRTVKWNSTSKFPLLDENGELVGTYGITRDITEQKQHFEEIRRLKEQVEAIFNSVPSMIFVKDYDGKYLMVNKAARDYFHPDHDIILGKTDEELGISKERAERYIKSDRKVIETNKPAFYSEEKTIRWDGKEFWHQTIKVPFSQMDNDEKAVLTVVTDVSKRVHYEVELTNSLAVISKQNERLSNFAHIVSHNLRNHSSGISMLAGLLNESKEAEEYAKYIGLLSTASERLKQTITDLNEIIDTEHSIEVDLKDIDFKKTLDGIKDVLQIEISKHNVEFVEELEEDLVFTYSQAYLDSIILNLISNAIKYRDPNKKPKIHIKGWKESERLMLIVKDNGRGMDLESYGDQLFGMYKTFHNHKNSKGIGLYITKNQVEALGGTIHVESEVNKGTTFIVDFGRQHRNKMLAPQ